MSPDEMKLDMLVAELDYENRLLRARNERLEREAEQRSQQNPAPVTDNTYGYAKSLAEAIFKQHFASDEHYASGRVVWGVFDTVEGILTQIDNMVADMVRRPAQHEPDYKALWQQMCERCDELDAKLTRKWIGLTDKETIFLIENEALGRGELVESVEELLQKRNGL